MPLFTPTIIINTTPAVSVTSTNVTYAEIKQSLGDYVYFVEELYLASTIFNQIKGILKYQHYNVNGNQVLDSLTPAPSPYQYQNTIFYNTKQFDVILDGQSNLKFKLLPNAQIKIQFFTNRVAKRDALDIINPNNFKSIESAMGIYQFFEDWNTKL